MKVVVSLEFPSWDSGGRNTGSGAQWRSMASWHARTGDRPCVCVYMCVCASCQFDGCLLLMWLVRVTITARCIHQPRCNWFICSATLTVASSSNTWLVVLCMMVWWWVTLKCISTMRPTIKHLSGGLPISVQSISFISHFLLFWVCLFTVLLIFCCCSDEWDFKRFLL